MLSQEEVNRWDDLERAKGREMVRVLDTEAITAQVEQALEAKNLELWVSPELLVGWSAAAICKKSRVCKMVAYGHSKHTAIKNLFFKLKHRTLEAIEEAGWHFDEQQVREMLERAARRIL